MLHLADIKRGGCRCWHTLGHSSCSCTKHWIQDLINWAAVQNLSCMLHWAVTVISSGSYNGINKGFPLHSAAMMLKNLSLVNPSNLCTTQAVSQTTGLLPTLSLKLMREPFKKSSARLNVIYSSISRLVCLQLTSGTIQANKSKAILTTRSEVHLNHLILHACSNQEHPGKTSSAVIDIFPLLLHPLNQYLWQVVARAISYSCEHHSSTLYVWSHFLDHLRKFVIVAPHLLQPCCLTHDCANHSCNRKTVPRLLQYHA